MCSLDLDQVVSTIHAAYHSLSFAPPPSQFTILASFFLFDPESCDIKIISLATGTKCLPAARLSHRGELIHDSHAEVLARRAALRWMLEEAARVVDGHGSAWIAQSDDSESSRFRLNPRVSLHLYISTLPCGDASMRYLAAVQDEDMAALKDSSSTFPALAEGTASRGRDNYARLGVLRTKPGRADSPPTLCMSCSDKIALWSVVGVQGALGSLIFEPLYLARIIVGDADVPHEAKRDVQEDCERAFGARLDGAKMALPTGFAPSRPTVHFSSIPFSHGKSASRMAGSCNEALVWLADCPQRSHEILINGLKRGVSPKHRYKDKSRCASTEAELSPLRYVSSRFEEIALGINQDLSSDPNLPYLHAKQLAKEYQQAKHAVLGPGGPFSGWLRTGVEFQQFDQLGTVSTGDDTTLHQ